MPLINRMNGILNCGMLGNLIVSVLPHEDRQTKRNQNQRKSRSMEPAGAAILVQAGHAVIL
jgi:hypothetical protein